MNEWMIVTKVCIKYIEQKLKRVWRARTNLTGYRASRTYISSYMVLMVAEHAHLSIFFSF